MASGWKTGWDKTDFEVYPHAIAEVFRKNDLAALAAGHSIESVEKSLDRDGEPCYWLTYKFPLQDASGQVLVAGIGLDITERRRADAELKRLNRALRSMTECNQVIARATEESRLLENVCEVLVREGGYRMAWVGYAEHDEGKAVFPIAHSGFEEGYLQAASITWADTDRGRRPYGDSNPHRETCGSSEHSDRTRSRSVAGRTAQAGLFLQHHPADLFE